MAVALTLPAPAKINLFLHILARNPDGYHCLQTLYQFLDHGADQLRLVRRKDDRLSLDVQPASLAPSEPNLVLRAALALRAHSGCSQGADLYLTKRIPVGGGLGGGSSDAATTLLGLNQLWGLSLSLEQLAAIGLTLGADVPVFVHGRSAWAEGIGEKLQFMVLDCPWYLVLDPGCQVSTRRIFSHPQLTRMGRMETMTSHLKDGSDERWRNDSERLVRHLYPQVGEALDWLGTFTRARLSGTGACVFGAFATLEQARAVKRQVPGSWRSLVARGMNRSSLHRFLYAPNRASLMAGEAAEQVAGESAGDGWGVAKR